MNTFCVDLNLNKPICHTNILPESLGDNIIHKKESKISNEMLDFLDRLDLSIRLAETFYIPPWNSIKIHEDGGDISDVLKINWVIGGDDSLMHWYESTTEPIWQKTQLGIKYKSYPKKNVKILHSQKVGFPSLVQVGIPHNVTTNALGRYCISVMPQWKAEEEILSFKEGIKLFEKFIV